MAVTAKLFEAAGRAGLKRSIYISSAAVHRLFAGEMSEEDGFGAADIYGATKGAGELFLRAACARHQMTGVVVRPGAGGGAAGLCRWRLSYAEADRGNGAGSGEGIVSLW